MEYRVDDRSLSGETFLDFVQQVWPGAYNLEQTRAALSKTMNFTAWDGGQLAGCLRVLTDGCFFGTITELLVLPAYQRQGIGSRLLRLAAAHTPTLLYFGAQPGAEAFYEKNGCQRRRSVRTASRSGSHSSGTASANSAGGRSHHRHARSNWTRSSGNRCFSTRTGLPPATV